VEQSGWPRHSRPGAPPDRRAQTVSGWCMMVIIAFITGLLLVLLGTGIILNATTTNRSSFAARSVAVGAVSLIVGILLILVAWL